MEKSLAVLRHEGLLSEFSDSNIIPGQEISAKLREKMNQADIFCFLISKNFLDSQECRNEWEYAVAQSKIRKVTLLPIILNHCDWKNFIDMKDYMALPIDANPVANFDNPDEAWLEICNGIRRAIDQIKRTFELRQNVAEELNSTYFLSQTDKVVLEDIFVFPSLHKYQKAPDFNRRIDKKDIMSFRHTIIVGDEMSGKTSFLRHIFLELIKQKKPSLYVDLRDIESKKANLHVFQSQFNNQFSGDFVLWKEQKNITVILDNLTQSANSMEHVLLALETFDKVIVSTQLDIYNSIFYDEVRLAKCIPLKISYLTPNQQENLIRKWLKSSSSKITDGLVDQFEREIDSIILNNKIVPRYPFYVLSILQSQETFMPKDLTITSYGHCYYVLILAHLIKSGISMKDGEIDACLNFASYYAFNLYKKNSQLSVDESEFKKIITEYKNMFVIKGSLINRLMHQEYGILKDRIFKMPYMYYYFLGRYFAFNFLNHKRTIEDLAQHSYITANCTTLIFAIHHSQDNQILDKILYQTKRTFSKIPSVSMNSNEVEILEKSVKNIQLNIISDRSVSEERKHERELRELRKYGEDDVNEPGERGEITNSVYRILKNNVVMGQILRNKHGSLHKEKLHEIIDAIIDGGLRLIRLYLLDANEANKIAKCIHEQNPDYDLDEIKEFVHKLVFVLAMNLVETIVAAINIPSLKELIQKKVEAKNLPVYDLIGYFSQLDMLIKDFPPELKSLLKQLRAKYKSNFMRGVISLRTQYYINTHKLSGPTRQSIFTILGIKPKIIQRNTNNKKE